MSAVESEAIIAATDHAVSDAVLSFDYVHPDYTPVWKRRLERLALLRSSPNHLAAARLTYRTDPKLFIEHWGVTVDPRNAGTGKPVLMPFLLFPKQREFIDELLDCWRKQEDLILVKSRDCGASWLAMGFAVTVCLFWQNASFGFGSAKEDKVDRSGDPDSLFYKGRKFTEYLPREFKGAWDTKKNSAHMRMVFPDSESSITGEAGDNIGRGGRKTMYFVDEFAHVERPKLVDAALIANTDIRVEMSSVQGTANVFAERARGGLIRRFDFHYRDDPRKTKEWIAKKKAKTDPVVWAAEYECDFNASVEGIIIPQDWVQAAIGAADKLGIEISGMRRGSYDVADAGKDKNCYGSRHGIQLEFIQSWSGQGSLLYRSVERVFMLCDERGDDGFDYDGDGMGAGVKSDVYKVLEARAEANAKRRGAFRELQVGQFRGSGKILDPRAMAPGTDRRNEDFFENYKAQSWWSLRHRFYATFRAIQGEDTVFDPNDLISIDPKLPELTRTTSELSQPVWLWSKSGKMMIDKTPDDVASPNNADTVMMLFPYARPTWAISDELIENLG